MKPLFKKAVIVGPGLIGGSIGINLLRKKLAKQVIGVARHPATLAEAKRKKAISVGTMIIEEAVRGADLIILATPVRSIQRILIQIQGLLSPGCIVCDAGSTKREIVATAERILPAGVHFVGAHPMAGSEKSGAQFAVAGLFNGTLCFITKTRRTNAVALARIKKLWETIGAAVTVLSPEAHDRIVAQVSHLPHLVSVALIESVQDEFLHYGASGLRDTTRIAAGDPDMWRDVSFSNKCALLKAISGFEKKIAAIKRSLEQNKEQQLMRSLERAKRKRDAL